MPKDLIDEINIDSGNGLVPPGKKPLPEPVLTHIHYIDVIMTTMASQIGRLLNRLFRRRSKKTSKLHVTGLFAGNSPGPVNSPHKGTVTRKMFPFDDVIMYEVGHL